MCDRKEKPGPIQLPFFWCKECQAVICGQDSLKKHSEMCNKGDRDGKLEEESLENDCSGKKEGKRQGEQDDDDESVPVSRVVNDELPVPLEQAKKTLDAEGNQTGLTVAEESISRPRVFEGPLNEKAGTSSSVVVKRGSTSSSRTDLSEVTVKMESVVEGILPGTTNADDEGIVEVEIIYYDCKLCGQEFRRLQDLRGHLEKAHEVAPAPASAIIMELQKSEMDVDNDEDGPPLLTYIGGEDLDQEVGAVDANRLLHCVAGKRIERIGLKPSADDRESRSRSPSVEILGFYQPAKKADGINQGSTSQIDITLCKSRLQKFSNETGSPYEEAMDVGTTGINNEGRSSAVRSSNRMQPTSTGYLSCKWCKSSFARNCHLTDHIRRYHPEQIIVQCTECNFKTAESLIKEHISNRHGIKQNQRGMASTTSTSKAFLIPQPQALPSRRGISLPHNNAAGGVPYGYGVSSSPSTSRNHVATASGVRTTYPTRKDVDVLNRKQDLNHVSKSVAGRASAGGTKKRISSRINKEHKCDECSKVCHRPSNLVDHKAMHSGQGPYTCPECGREDWCRYRMKQHMKGVHGIVNVPATRAAEYPSHL